MFLYTTAKFVCVGRTVVEIGTVHPRLSKSRLSDTSIIRTQNCHFARFCNRQHLHGFHNVGVACENFQSSKAMWSAENALTIEEKLDICKFRSYTEHYGSRRSTTVAKSWKILEENGRHRWISLIWTNSLIWTLLKSTMTKGVRITEDAL